MTLIDTNAILRYLLDDITEQADAAQEVIKKGAYTLDAVLAEVVYVLTKSYGVARDKVGKMLIQFLDEIAIREKDVIVCALRVYSASSFDFVDCLLIARKEVLGEDVFTFDKKLAHRLRHVQINSTDGEFFLAGD